MWRAQRFQAPVLCLFGRHALPSVMGVALPGRPALYSPEAQEPGITRGQAAHGSVPSVCSRHADQWLSTCALRNPVPTT